MGIPFRGEYIDFCSRCNGVVITGYSSKSQNKKITFQGDNAVEEYSRWTVVEGFKPEPKPTKVVSRSKNWVDINDQIGSDEVGVGDFLGPMIVVATYIKKEDINLLKELGVTDSKKLTDQNNALVTELAWYRAKYGIRGKEKVVKK